MDLARILRGFGANASGQLASVCLQLLLVPVLASQWGLERYGIWILLSSIPSYLALSDLGFGTAATVRMTIDVAAGKLEPALRTYQSAWCLAVLVTAVLYAILLLSLLIAPQSLFNGLIVPPEEIRLTLALLAGYGLVSLQFSFATSPLRATGRYATATYLQTLVFVVDGLLLAACGMMTTSLPATASALLAARGIMLIGIFAVSSRLVPSFRIGWRHASSGVVAELLPSALATTVIPLSQALFLQGTTFAIALGTSPVAVPVFTAVRTLVRTGVQLTGLLNHALMPEVSAAKGRNDSELQRVFVGMTVLGSIVILVPLAAVLLFGGNTILEIWTRGAISAPSALMVTMVAVMVANGTWHPLSNLLLAANRAQEFSYTFAIAAAAVVPMTYAAALTSGLEGAGLSLLAMDLFMVLHVTRATKRSLLGGTSLWQAVRDALGVIYARAGSR